jgi:hypothetical protein
LETNNQLRFLVVIFTFQSFRIDKMNNLSDTIANANGTNVAHFFGQLLRQTHNIVLLRNELDKVNFIYDHNIT